MRLLTSLEPLSDLNGRAIRHGEMCKARAEEPWLYLEHDDFRKTRCLKVPPVGREVCWRPTGHPGSHSWEPAL